MLNLFFWRSYCPNCWAHIKGYMWVKIAGSYSGHHLASCPICESVIEKYDTLSEEGFGRAVRLKEDDKEIILTNQNNKGFTLDWHYNEI